ncbi:aspartate/glutamate racemase family protein [Paenibacillus radicis (ex Gao et al. 2016)]|uniref:Aspartate racemase n=1 Tax=Paenibacillus radicis (ex Gao et al. 2016) TaxID=1737354 RepID=A0A917MAQ3_9BACL|nr:amino acid racemase [Paenibacillus radicis (ex Gao et al. 2016)]GGG88468.1 aspartate racemase [Paenibacillus radicis (ex Gao et al. 2016)]
MSIRGVAAVTARQRLGVLGGMGPQATAVFMERVIARTAAKQDQEHIDMIVLNHASLPDRTDAITSGDHVAFIEAVRKDLELLELAGTANIAIPCNTSHFFYEQMQRLTSVPIIHMVNETVQEVSKSGDPVSRVGLLATDGTIKSGVYAESCERYGLEYVIPAQSLQRKVSQIIYEQVKRDGNLNAVELIKVVQQMRETYRCDRIILACTELSCIPLPLQIRSYVIDAMDVLVERAIERSGGAYLAKGNFRERIKAYEAGII